MSLNAASAALAVSQVPLKSCVAAVRVAILDGKVKMGEREFNETNESFLDCSQSFERPITVCFDESPSRWNQK